MSNDICGYTTASDTPCKHPPSEDDGRCWQHTDAADADPGGRPRELDDEQTRQRILVAVGQGLKVSDQAALAGISPDTLRRGLCCVETPRQPTLEPDPCDFCANYAQAHANGAREILQDCRAEFIASASYGYVKKEKQQLENTGDDPLADVTIDFSNVDT